MNNGSYALFEQVFRVQYPIVLRQIMQLVGSRTVAEDLAQEVFIRLHRHPPDDLSKVGPWLHRTLTRVSYDYLKQLARQKRLEQRMLNSGTVLEVVQPSSEQDVLHQIDSEAVRRALGCLSERDRQALLLKYAGYSYNEIAEALQVNSNTVATLLLRAMTRLKRHFEKEVTNDHAKPECL